MRRLLLLIAVLGVPAGLLPVATGSAAPPGFPDAATGLYTNGRLLQPMGRQTTLGNFPSGGALSPDGRFYWAVNSGHGRNSVSVVDVESGEVAQTLPLPGGYIGVAFAPDGRRAYVSGEPRGEQPALPEYKGDKGDVVHVYDVDPASGRATELDPLALPACAYCGSGQVASVPPVSSLYPSVLEVSPDGRWLAVVLAQADRVAVLDLRGGEAARLIPTDTYPYAVAWAADSSRFFVTSEGEGTVTAHRPTGGGRIGRAEVGGTGIGARRYAHPEGMVVDPARHLLYVAVASRDKVAVVDTDTYEVIAQIDVGRPQGIGTSPTSLAISPDGATLYAVNSNEDAIAVIALADRPAGGPKRFDVIGRLPTAAYPTAVAVTPDGAKLIWLAAKGYGAGPNPDDSYLPDRLTGRLGVLDQPTDAQAAAATAKATAQVTPSNVQAPPPNTPLIGATGGASDKIKYVFYVVRENRTYDQIFGAEPRGEGDPSLQLFDDNGVPGPAGGVTPNAHALARTFPLLDNVYANSEVSIDGHLITSGGYAIDYAQKNLHANYSARGRSGDVGIFPIALPPNGFSFDQAARQGIPFRVYGELGGGNNPLSNDGRPTFTKVLRNTDVVYPTNLQLNCTAGQGPPGRRCFSDSGLVGGTGAPGLGLLSRIDVFKAEFRWQLLTRSVPRFNYLILPNDHTNGTDPTTYTPRAAIADNDLALGQLVELISQSRIWNQSAIFVVEDDSQDGADHVDAHRMPAFVISPWARRGAVVSTRYDQYSVLRTAMMTVGLRPVSLNDALATPMYDAFISGAQQPDVDGTRYRAIQPEVDLREVNPPDAPMAALSAALPFDRMDATPQSLSDRILWRSVYGDTRPVPPPGPNASAEERERAEGALEVYRDGGDVRDWLLARPEDDDG